jgi:DNA-directed RNA polymerase specialized sigma24 family protein
VTVSVPTLNPSAWEALLARLGSDRDAAGAEYEMLRRRLVRFFEWRGRSACEEPADVVLTRLANKLAAGETILNVQSYALGVARFVLMELAAEPAAALLDESVVANRHAEVPVDDESDARATCLDECLEQLPDRSRQTVLDYYAGDGSSRIVKRQTMAERMGISDRALRLRVFRIRGTLESCVHGCLGGPRRTPAETEVATPPLAKGVPHATRPSR